MNTYVSSIKIKCILLVLILSYQFAIGQDNCSKQTNEGISCEINLIQKTLIDSLWHLKVEYKLINKSNVDIYTISSSDSVFDENIVQEDYIFGLGGYWYYEPNQLAPYVYRKIVPNSHVQGIINFTISNKKSNKPLYFAEKMIPKDQFDVIIISFLFGYYYNTDISKIDNYLTFVEPSYYSIGMNKNEFGYYFEKHFKRVLVPISFNLNY